MSIFTNIQETASEFGHGVILIEHVVLTLLENDEAVETLKALDPSIDFESAKKLVTDQLTDYPRKKKH